MTSHDVVAAIRRGARGAKVGHAGTLDPMATGVLVICVGAATRLAEWASDADKRYVAEVTLGVETTTFDADGDETARRPVTIERQDVERSLEAFRGQIKQRPPAYSAVQRDGRRSYDLARRGEAPELEERTVVIRDLVLLDWQSPIVTLDATCSKGTYIRSLAHDIGAALGTGAHLSALRRIASGPFAIEQAVALAEAQTAVIEGRLLPMELAVADLPRLELVTTEVDAVRHGRCLDRSESLSPVRAHGPDGDLIAILDWRGDAWWPRKVLAG